MKNEVYYSTENDGDVYRAKSLSIKGDTTFVEETITEPTYPTGGVRLFAAMETIRDLLSEDELVITVNGWKQNAAAITGTAKIRAHAAEREAVEFAVDGGYLFQGISSVAITGGSSGEKVTLFFLPAVTTFHELGFNPKVAAVEGEEYFDVPRRLDPSDHRKLQRATNEITVSDKSEASGGSTNIINLKGKTVMVIDQRSADGGSYVNETLIYRGVKIKEAVAPPAVEGGAEVTDVKATGKFSGLYAIAAIDEDTSAAYIT